MKKITILASAILALSNVASADTLGAKLGVEYHNSNTKVDGDKVSSKDNNFRGFVAFEHFVPVLPNLKLEYSKYDADTIKYSQTSVTGYYQLIDMDHLALDFGLGGTRFSGVEGVGSLDSENSAHLYAAAEIGIPETGVSFFAEGKRLGLSDIKGYDFAAGAKYTAKLNSLPLSYGFTAGYRVSDYSFEKVVPNSDFDLRNNGVFAGVHLNF